MQNVTITTQPASEPVTLSDAKLFMRVDISDDDALITEMIVAARQLCEEYTRRKFINTGITLALDGFPLRSLEKWWDGVQQMAESELYSAANYIKLPFPPAVSITSITTYNRANASAVFASASYRLDTAGTVYLNDGYSWPNDLRDYDSVRVVYVAGYGSNAAAVPSMLKHAVKMTVAAMYDDRSCVAIPEGARRMLDPYRVLEERRNAM